MTAYLDTSCLIKLYVDEPDRNHILRLVQDASVIVTSALTYPEARATLARRRRERLMTAAEASAAVAQLDADWPRLAVIPVSDELGRAAGRLADRHGLRGADAVHLASFELLLSHCDDEVQFSSADDRLSRAAGSL